jgi:hypothetical protein
MSAAAETSLLRRFPPIHLHHVHLGEVGWGQQVLCEAYSVCRGVQVPAMLFSI